jgi:hypothetical protein
MVAVSEKGLSGALVVAKSWDVKTGGQQTRRE